MEKNASLKIVNISVNGNSFERAIPPSMTLLEFIRDELKLKGTKRGCDKGECGACTVLLEGKPTLSCILLAAEADGKKVVTIEGVSDGINLHKVQEAMVENGAIQCGFCTSSMVLNAIHLIENNPKPNREEIKECISGTICRCTGYTKIINAIECCSKGNVTR